MTGWLVPAILAMIIWGFWGFFPKMASQCINPASVSIYQVGGNLIISLGILASIGFKPEFNSRGIAFAVLSGVAGTLGSIFFNIAARNGRISAVVTLTALYPLITILLAFFWLNEPIGTREICGLTLAITAIIILST